jgi:adenylylsulfate kinase
MTQMESSSRSLAKAVSYRVFGSLSTAAIFFVYSGDVKLSVGIGALDSVVKIFLYFCHERLWNYIQLGRPKAPDYEI